MKIFFYSSLLFVSAFLSCDKDDVKPVNEDEVITTVKLTFTPQGGGETVVLTSKDLDGFDGPNLPSVSQTGTFAKSKTYTTAVAFLNELETPVEDITVEVQEEAADHQVFYQVTNTLPTFTYVLGTGNVDANGKPIGVNAQFITGATAASGNIVVTLRHLPNKSASGVSDGNITNAGGSTDASATFSNIQIQ